MMKRLLICLLTLTMLFQITACVDAATPAFADVPADAPYAQAVAWCNENGLMIGVGNGANFDPDGSMSRAMLATVLYRQAGEPAVSGAPQFTDTQAGAWYSNAVAWAVEKALLRGYGKGLFGVNDPVSKEMLSVVIARQNGEDPAWTGSAELAVPATRAEAAVALYETFAPHEPEPTPIYWPSSGGATTPTLPPTPSPSPAPESGKEPDTPEIPSPEMNKMTIQIGDTVWTATLEDNPSAAALKELLGEGPLTVDMRDYGGFEKVGSLGTTLPQSNRQITTKPGDIILYQGNSITIYYDENSWNFTLLGHIDDVTETELREVLKAGGEAISVTFSLD